MLQIYLMGSQKSKYRHWTYIPRKASSWISLRFLGQEQDGVGPVGTGLSRTGQSRQSSDRMRGGGMDWDWREGTALEHKKTKCKNKTMTYSDTIAENKT